MASVTTNATKQYLEEGLNGTEFWFGGNDIEKEGDWKWTDCTPWEFTFWSSGEGWSNPNNAQGSQNCLQWQLRWGWDDDWCINIKNFVCSKQTCTGKMLK